MVAVAGKKDVAIVRRFKQILLLLRVQSITSQLLPYE
jgi:hypothetical protein